MMQITIGRNPGSTIVVSSSYDTVSGNHATIISQNGALVLQDHSTNGSLVNGQRVHNTSVQIQPTDRIQLGTNYLLNMNDVMRFLGNNQTQRYPVGGTRPAGGYNQVGANAQGGNVNVVINNPEHSHHSYRKEEPKCLHRWNWGAFWLGWIWAIGNGVWWGLLELIPIVNFVVIFILAINGNQHAWDKFNGTAAEFDEKQHSWAVAGWIVFALSFVFGLIRGLVLVS